MVWKVNLPYLLEAIAAAAPPPAQPTADEHGASFPTATLPNPSAAIPSGQDAFAIAYTELDF